MIVDKLISKTEFQDELKEVFENIKNKNRRAIEFKDGKTVSFNQMNGTMTMDI